MTMTKAADASSSFPCPPILRGIQAALGQSLLDEILSCRILLVGSGGIGCELLKNLALSGFRNVEVIDLDTIDVSNLNRQFLFRSQHVGMPKCVVASEAAMKMIPPLTNTNTSSSSYLPHHGNIFDNSKFNVQYIQTFALVLNALDNVAARRQVNRLCLAASVPLIEAGTAGYLGQVTVIDKQSNTECYECQTKPTQKVYPICTIRSTPSQPVHCIVWAKELYKLLFGPKVEESMLFEDEESLRAEKRTSSETTTSTTTEAEADATEGGEPWTTTSSEGGGEKSTYMDLVIQIRTILRSSSTTEEASHDLVRQVGPKLLFALFATEIRKQIDMGRYKTAEKVPVPISWKDFDKSTNENKEEFSSSPSSSSTDIWAIEDCIVEIMNCFHEVVSSSPDDDPNFPLPEFDKDCDMAMRFVTASSNLRSYVFQIEPLQSVYSAKGIAGNIIPAIATTNAIVAGLQVLQCFHILKAQRKMRDASNKNYSISMGSPEEEQSWNLKDMCRYTYCLRDKTRKGYLLQPTTLPDPNPNCFVCRNATISLALNTQLWTLDMLLTRIIKKELGFSSPSIMVGEDIVYEEGNDINPSEYAANKVKKLVSLPGGGMGHGSSLRIEDFTQDLEVEVIVTHKENFIVEERDGETGSQSKDDTREEIEKFEIGGKKPMSASTVAPLAINNDGSTSGSKSTGGTPSGDSTENINDDEGDIEVIEQKNFSSLNDCTDGMDSPQKKRPQENPMENGNKKAKYDSFSGISDVDVVCLDK